jgi:hypothetical protein
VWNIGLRSRSPLTFHSSSNLVLVDVIARNPKNGLPDKTLTRADFELFDSGHPVPIKTLRSYGWLLSQ